MFGDADFAWLDGLRRAHFPPERNQVPAHLTLFHHLPPGLGGELRQRLRAETMALPAPAARITGLRDLGGGVALAVRSEGLAMIRERLAGRFAGMLMPQDAAGWRPHVTIQNKAGLAAAVALRADLDGSLRLPRPLTIAGLAAWRYVGGPWERIAGYRF